MGTQFETHDTGEVVAKWTKQQHGKELWVWGTPIPTLKMMATPLIGYGGEVVTLVDLISQAEREGVPVKFVPQAIHEAMAGDDGRYVCDNGYQVRQILGEHDAETSPSKVNCDSESQELLSSLMLLGVKALGACPSRSTSESVRNCAQEELFEEIAKTASLLISYLSKTES